MPKSMYAKMGVKKKGAKPGDLMEKANKMTLKTAMKKYESSAADKKRDLAGAKKLMKKANKK